MKRFELYESNGGNLFLVQKDKEDVVVYMHDYHSHKEDLVGDLKLIANGADPAAQWDGNDLKEEDWALKMSRQEIKEFLDDLEEVEISSSSVSEEKYFVKSGYWEDSEIYNNIEDAKKGADELISYNQEDVIIYNEKNEEVCRRTWYGGVEYDKDENDEEDPILFGDFGFYGDWQ